MKANRPQGVSRLPDLLKTTTSVEQKLKTPPTTEAQLNDATLQLEAAEQLTAAMAQKLSGAGPAQSPTQAEVNQSLAAIREALTTIHSVRPQEQPASKADIEQVSALRYGVLSALEDLGAGENLVQLSAVKSKLRGIVNGPINEMKSSPHAAVKELAEVAESQLSSEWYELSARFEARRSALSAALTDKIALREGFDTTASVKTMDALRLPDDARFSTFAFAMATSLERSPPSEGVDVKDIVLKLKEVATTSEAIARDGGEAKLGLAHDHQLSALRNAIRNAYPASIGDERVRLLYSIMYNNGRVS